MHDDARLRRRNVRWLRSACSACIWNPVSNLAPGTTEKPAPKSLAGAGFRFGGVFVRARRVHTCGEAGTSFELLPVEGKDGMVRLRPVRKRNARTRRGVKKPPA